MLSPLRKAADGAVLATETRAQVTPLFSVREPVVNDALPEGDEGEALVLAALSGREAPVLLK